MPKFQICSEIGITSPRMTSIKQALQAKLAELPVPRSQDRLPFVIPATAGKQMLLRTLIGLHRTVEQGGVVKVP